MAPVEEEEGEDLCNCEFSLAYGGKILLNNARLHLKRGQRYGLCGPNGAGKSTLMRAIANGQLDGFPPKSELRTVYVEHDIDASGGWWQGLPGVAQGLKAASGLQGRTRLALCALPHVPPAQPQSRTCLSCLPPLSGSPPAEAETPVVEFVVNDNMVKEVLPSRERIIEVLESVGFDAERQALPVASLSGEHSCWVGGRHLFAGLRAGRGLGLFGVRDRGMACESHLSIRAEAAPARPHPPALPPGGWKMKLALARAMLMNADIMLLDEPTNHLDVTNVQVRSGRRLVGGRGCPPQAAQLLLRCSASCLPPSCLSACRLLNAPSGSPPSLPPRSG